MAPVVTPPAATATASTGSIAGQAAGADAAINPDEATVELDPVSPPSNPVRTATIAAGRFVLLNVPNGQYRIWAHGADTFSDQQSVNVRGHREALSAPLLLRFGAPTPTAVPPSVTATVQTATPKAATATASPTASRPSPSPTRAARLLPSPSPTHP